MPLIALALVLIAAALHAGWNLLVKRAKEKQIFTWWALVVGTICFAPLLVLDPLPITRIWLYVVCSALVEGLYYITLTRAYEKGDFSLIYPMARGTAPALLAIWAVLFLDERPHLAGFAGLALLILGLIVVGGNVWWSLRKTSALSASGVGLALGTALCISIYSAIDGAAVRLAPPLSYTVLIIGLSSVFITPLMVVQYGYHTVTAEWRANWPRIILVGILSLLSYMLVLYAYSVGRVSYAGAIREVSIVFAAIVGWRWLGENFGGMRTVGAILIFAGILVIAVAG